jgi:hypothetical protein
LPFSLIKKKAADLLTGKPAKNRYKCTKNVMGDDKIGHKPPTDLAKCQQSTTHAHERQLRLGRRASQENYAGLAPTESSSTSPVAGHRCRRGTLHRSSDSTAPQRSTRRPVGHAGNRLSKPKPRPKLCLTPHRCQTARSAPSKATHQPSILESPGRSPLRDNALNRERDTEAPPSSDPKDLRFPSGGRTPW